MLLIKILMLIFLLFKLVMFFKTAKLNRHVTK